MLAMRLEGDVAQQDDLVIAADLFECARQMHRRILVVTLAIILPCTRDAPGCFDQAFSRGFLAEPTQQRLDRRETLGGYRSVPGSAGRGNVTNGQCILPAQGWRSGGGGGGGDRR